MLQTCPRQDCGVGPLGWTLDRETGQECFQRSSISYFLNVRTGCSFVILALDEKKKSSLLLDLGCCLWNPPPVLRHRHASLHQARIKSSKLAEASERLSSLKRLRLAQTRPSYLTYIFLFRSHLTSGTRLNEKTMFPSVRSAHKSLGHIDQMRRLSASVVLVA